MCMMYFTHRIDVQVYLYILTHISYLNSVTSYVYKLIMNFNLAIMRM